MTVKMLAR